MILARGLLLDPKFVVIDPNGSNTYADADSWDENPGETMYIKGSNIAERLLSANLDLYANTDINIIDDIAVTGTGGYDLTLEAGRSDQICIFPVKTRKPNIIRKITWTVLCIIRTINFPPLLFIESII